MANLSDPSRMLAVFCMGSALIVSVISGLLAINDGELSCQNVIFPKDRNAIWQRRTTSARKVTADSGHIESVNVPPDEVVE